MYQCEDLADIGSCLVTNLLLLGMEDKVYKVADSLEALHTLMINAKSSIKLSMKEEMLGLPILCAYKPHRVMRVSEASSWEISETRAMTYDTLYTQLVKLGLRMGLERELFSCYTAYR